MSCILMPDNYLAFLFSIDYIRKGYIQMKKTTAIILILVLALAGAAGIWGMVVSMRNDSGYSFSMQKNLEITDGKADPEKISVDFGIDEDGLYNISLMWTPMGKKLSDLRDLQPSDYSFITGCVISSADDPCVYATSAGWMSVDTDINLKAGNYTISFYYLTSREAYADFAAKYFGTESAEKMADWFEWDGFKKSDKLVVSYRNTVSSLGGRSLSGAWLALVIVSISGMLILIILMYIGKDGIKKADYDERQQIERGKSAILGFYTLLGYMLIMFIADAVGLIDSGLLTPVYMGGMILGVTVSAVYSIWHECYFALNQNRVRNVIVLALIFVMNLASGIFDMNLARKMDPFGNITETRLFRVGFCAIELAAGFLVLAAVLLLKHAKDKKEEEE